MSFEKRAIRVPNFCGNLNDSENTKWHLTKCEVSTKANGNLPESVSDILKCTNSIGGDTQNFFPKNVDVLEPPFEGSPLLRVNNTFFPNQQNENFQITLQDLKHMKHGPHQYACFGFPYEIRAVILSQNVHNPDNEKRRRHNCSNTY